MTSVVVDVVEGDSGRAARHVFERCDAGWRPSGRVGVRRGDGSRSHRPNERDMRRLGVVRHLGAIETAKAVVLAAASPSSFVAMFVDPLAGPLVAPSGQPEVVHGLDVSISQAARIVSRELSLELKRQPTSSLKQLAKDRGIKIWPPTSLTQLTEVWGIDPWYVHRYTRRRRKRRQGFRELVSRLRSQLSVEQVAQLGERHSHTGRNLTVSVDCRGVNSVASLSPK